MSELVYDRREELLEWAAEKIGIQAFRSDAQAIGLERSGVPVAVVVFDSFSPTDCAMHVASDGSGHWLTRRFLVHAFVYPFVQCRKLRVTSPIAESNQKALRFNRHLGFRQEGYHPYGAEDGALLTMGLLRKDCRFIPKSERHMRND